MTSVLAHPDEAARPPGLSVRLAGQGSWQLTGAAEHRRLLGRTHDRHRHPVHRPLDPAPDRHLGRRRPPRGGRLGVLACQGRVGQRGLASWPRCARTRSPTASTPGSSPPGLLQGRRQAAPRPNGSTTTVDFRDRPGGCCSATLRRHRRAGPLVGPVLAARWATCRDDVDHLRGDLRRRRAGHGDPVLARCGGTARASARWPATRSPLGGAAALVACSPS